MPEHKQPTPRPQRAENLDHLDEQAVLGAMLWGQIEPAVDQLTSSSFHDHRHASIYAHLTAAWANGAPTDPIALAGALQDAGELERVGGLGYLHRLYHVGGGITAVGYYAQRVAAAADARDTINLGLRITQLGETVPDQYRRADLLSGMLEHHLNGHKPLLQPLGQPLDWHDLLSGTAQPPDWLAGKLLCRGQQVALVGEGKAGKSLLAHEWAWRAAAGLPFLGDVARPPLRVLYIDQENSLDEIADRMRAFGATPDQLHLVDYRSFPPLPPLNTAAGGAALAQLADRHRAQLIFLDTISRMVEGEENPSDVWLALYRYTLIPLKAAGRACIRLDHFGKDTTRGARGSSAKTQDVDHVWELAAGLDHTLQLTRSHTRTGVGVDNYTLRRLGQRTPDGWAPGQTRHVLADQQNPLSVAIHALAAKLDDAGIPAKAGRLALREACAKLGIKVSNELLSAVSRFRRAVDATERYGDL